MIVSKTAITVEKAAKAIKRKKRKERKEAENIYFLF